MIRLGALPEYLITPLLGWPRWPQAANTWTYEGQKHGQEGDPIPLVPHPVQGQPQGTVCFFGQALP